MKLSVSVTNYSWPDSPIRDELASLTERLDHTAVDTLWVADHLLQADPSSSLDEPMLEAYTTLGFLAARSTRLRLGTMVSAATFRAPALLIKAVTTLDVLSGGRAWLGIGAGYNDDEARAMGLHLPRTAERFDWLAELLQLARQMWDGDNSAFRGNHLRLEHAVGSPASVSARPPVLIGGTGERRTLRLVAQYADACNLFDIPDGGQTLKRKLVVLKQLAPNWVARSVRSSARSARRSTTTRWSRWSTGAAGFARSVRSMSCSSPGVAPGRRATATS